MLLDTSKLSDLSLAKKVELLEVLTNALATHEKDFESPLWHKAALEQRKLESSSPELWLSFDDVQKSL